jgi:hypothetical protein
MSNIAFIAWLSSADGLALDPKVLQPALKGWRQKAQRLQESAEADGLTVIRIALDPQQFADWCRDAGVDPDSKERAQYAVFLGQQRQEQ